MLDAMALNRVKFTPSTEEKGDRVSDLVTRASQGSGEAFGQLYQMYVDRIYNYIYYNTEISATMGKKEGAIRALQYRALLALQRILQDERYGLERSPARAT